MSEFLNKYKAFCAKDNNLEVFTSTSITGKGKGLLYSVFAGSTRSLKNISNEGISYVKEGATNKSVRQGQFKAFVQTELLAGYFSYDKKNDTYIMTPKGHCVENLLTEQELKSVDYAFCITLLSLLDGKFRNSDGIEEDNCFVRNIIKLIGIFHNVGYTLNDILRSCESLLNASKLNDFAPWNYEIFWLISFYRDQEFLKSIKGCINDEIEDVVKYIEHNKKEKNDFDIVSKKYKSGGQYQINTFIEDVEITYSLLKLVLRINSIERPSDLWSVLLETISYSRDISKDIVLSKIENNNEVFDLIFKNVKSDPLISSFSALLKNNKGVKIKKNMDISTISYSNLLTAIHTKPFLILGGFSGTGKSQKVKELAYLTCPKWLQDEKTPGNYALISVKPNWHDSTELLGYESTIANKYMVTDFMRFVVKAMQYPKTPFFCCMDEMNLAPVEEYFAEFLSVLESRKKITAIDEEGKQITHIVSEALVSADVFRKSYKSKENKSYYNIFEDLGLKKVDRLVGKNEATTAGQNTKITSEVFEREDIVALLKKEGLCIPENLVVIGTVNMDDTTNSFSRKVIDRAMIFETDIETFEKEKYFNAEDTLQYGNVDGAAFICDEVRADKAIEAGYELSEEDRQNIIDYINELNKAMAGTSFQISYRVLNEMILYYRSMQMLNEGKASLDQVKSDILMMKVLPRIEGDSAAKKALVGLKTMIEKQNIPSEWINVSYDIDAETIASKPKTPWKDSILKISYMLNLLNTGDGFTRFWK